METSESPREENHASFVLPSTRLQPGALLLLLENFSLPALWIRAPGQRTSREGELGSSNAGEASLPDCGVVAYAVALVQLLRTERRSQ